jgi:hypothetical protein
MNARKLSSEIGIDREASESAVAVVCKILDVDSWCRFCTQGRRLLADLENVSAQRRRDETALIGNFDVLFAIVKLIQKPSTEKERSMKLKILVTPVTASALK